jgi:hypothetical protein
MIVEFLPEAKSELLLLAPHGAHFAVLAGTVA